MLLGFGGREGAGKSDKSLFGMEGLDAVKDNNPI